MQTPLARMSTCSPCTKDTVAALWPALQRGAVALPELNGHVKSMERTTQLE